MPNVFDLAVIIAGWLGASLLLLAYWLNSSGRLKMNRRYHLMNLIGAAGIAISTGIVGAYPAMSLNLIWMLIAIKSLTVNSDHRS